MARIWARNQQVEATQFIYLSAETPSPDPEALRLAALEACRAECHDLSENVVAEAMGIARAVSGINFDPDNGTFVLADPFTGSSEGMTFPMSVARIPDVGTARAVVDRYTFLANNGNLDVDGDTIYYMANPDEDDEATITDRQLEGLLLDPASPQNFQEYQAAGAVSIEAIQAVAAVPAVEVTAEPLRHAATGLTYDPTPAPIEPHELSFADQALADITSVMPPAPVAVEAVEGVDHEAAMGIARAVDGLNYNPDTQSFELNGEYNQDFSIPAQFITSEEQGLAAVTEFNRLLSEGYLTIEGEEIYYLTSLEDDAPTHTLNPQQLMYLLGASVGEVEVPELIVPERSEAQEAQILSLLGDDTETFLANRPVTETPEETMAVARGLSILKGRATELQEAIAAIPARMEAARNRPVDTSNPYAAYAGFSLEGEIMALEAEEVNLTADLEDFQEGYQNLLHGEVGFDDSDIRALIDRAGAAISGRHLAALAEDDGIEAAEVSPEDQARLDNAREFIDAFAQFRPGQDELYDRAYQLLNNKDVAGVEAILEDILDASVRHWYHNFWGSERFETGEQSEVTYVDPTNGLEVTYNINDVQDITAARIMNDPTALSQALREIEAYDAAERVMLNASRTDLLDESTELSQGETEVLNRFYDQLFTEDGNFNFDAPAAVTAAAQVDAMIDRFRTVDPQAVEPMLAQRDELIVSSASSTVFRATMDGYLAENSGNVDQLNHLMQQYSDMTGIGGEWNNFSDANLAIAREVGLFAAGFLIPVGAITGMLARIGRTVNMARRAAVARVATAAGRVLQGPGDEIARAAVAAPVRPVVRFDQLAANVQDDLLRALGGSDDASAVARSIREAGFQRPNNFLLGALDNGGDLTRIMEVARAASGSTDDLALAALRNGRSLDEIYAAVGGTMDDFLPLAVQVGDRSDEVLAFAMRNGAALDHIATLGGTFDDILRVATQNGRTSEALTYGLQSGRATIDDIILHGADDFDNIITAARQAGWNADEAVILALNSGSSDISYLYRIINAVDGSVDDIAQRALLEGGRFGQPLNGERIYDLLRRSNIDPGDFLGRAHAGGATPQSIAAVGRAAGLSDEAIGLLNGTMGPRVMSEMAMPPQPMMAGAGDDLVGLSDDLLTAARHSDDPVQLRAAIARGVDPTDARIVSEFSDETLDGLRAIARSHPERLPAAVQEAVVAARAAEVPAGTTVISLGRARELMRGIRGLPQNVADDLAPHLARMRAGVANSADEFMAAYRALPATQQRFIQVGLAAAATPAMLSLLPENFFASEAVAEPVDDSEALGAPMADPLNLGPVDRLTVLPDPVEVVETPAPTLDEQMEAIGSSDIRRNAEAIRTILEERMDSYQAGDWAEISDQLAELFEVNLEGADDAATQANRLAFGNAIQARIRAVLHLPEDTPDLDDGKIGTVTMRHLERALMGITGDEITEAATWLQAYESQPNWRDNNRAIAAHFGINFAADATDAQLRMFGESLQGFAYDRPATDGRNDGAIGAGTLRTLRTRLESFSEEA